MREPSSRRSRHRRPHPVPGSVRSTPTMPASQPPLPTRPTLKHTSDLSDEELCLRWVPLLRQPATRTAPSGTHGSLARSRQYEPKRRPRGRRARLSDQLWSRPQPAGARDRPAHERRSYRSAAATTGTLGPVGARRGEADSDGIVGAMRDFAEAIRLSPTSVRQDYDLTAELYSLQSGVYASCPESAFRDGRRAVETAAQAVALDPSRPTLLTILAAAYASTNDFASAVQFQQRALNSSRFPPRYRDDAERQLRQYRESLTLQQSTGR